MKQFKKYEGADTAQDIKMPRDTLRLNTFSTVIGELMTHFEEFTDPDNKVEGPELYPWADRFVMGYPLPE